MTKGKTRTEEEALAYIEPLIPMLEVGLSVHHSCNMTKLSESSVKIYKNKYESVKLELLKAKSKSIADAAKTINKAAKEDWKPALEVLKRRNKKEWGDNVDVTSGNEKLPTPILGGISKEDK